MLKQLLRAFIPRIKNLPPVTKTTRKILYETNDMAVVSFQWKKGDVLPDHDHYGKCLYEVLDGKLVETRGNQYAALLIPDTLGVADIGTRHSIIALEDSTSIHVYCPPPPHYGDESND